jgi:hypothetical protein
LSKGEPHGEENLALAANTRKGRGRRFPSRKNQDRRPGQDHERKKIDMLKIKWYNCLRFGHFARDCTMKKKFNGKH